MGVPCSPFIGACRRQKSAPPPASAAFGTLTAVCIRKHKVWTSMPAWVLPPQPAHVWHDGRCWRVMLWCFTSDQKSDESMEKKVTCGGWSPSAPPKPEAAPPEAPTVRRSERIESWSLQSSRLLGKEPSWQRMSTRREAFAPSRQANGLATSM
jgi:hypothetical protein